MQHRAVFIEQGSAQKPIQFPDLGTLRHLQSLPGESGGVHICEHIYEGEARKFVLIRSTSAEHLKYQVLANTIYARFNIRVPQFAVYEQLPPELFQECKFEQRQADLFVLAEFIEGIQPRQDDLVKMSPQFKLAFILDAFLKNRDAIKLENIIINKRGIFRVDNGNCLFFRERGELEEKGLNNVIDIQNMRDENYSPNGKILYGDLTDEEIHEQRVFLVKHAGIIFDTFHELNRVIKFQQPNHLYDLLVNRLNSIKNDDFTCHESKEERLIAAAGVFIYSQHCGEIYALLGCRKGKYSRTFCSLGGTRDEGESILQTAIREVEEETALFGMHQIKFSEEQLRYLPYKELTGPNSYRMYFAYHDYFTIDEMIDRMVEDEDDEYSEFVWVRLNDLIAGLVQHQASFKVTVAETKEQIKIKLYPFMSHFIDRTNSLQNLIKIASQSRPFNFEPAHKVNQHVIEHGMNQRLVIKELKHKDTPRRELAYPVEQKRRPFDSHSISELALDCLIDKKMDDLEQKVDTFIANHPGSKKLDARCKEIILKNIREEKLNPNVIRVYHVVKQKIGVIYDLYGAIYTLLSEHESFRFRLNETEFHKLKNIAEFYNHFDDAYEEYINYRGNYPDLCLSVNPTLFSEPNRESSNCLSLFANAANEIDEDDTFETGGVVDRFFERLGLTDAERNELLLMLKDAYESVEHVGGRFCTILIDPTVADQCLHPAKRGGKISPAANQNFSMVDMIRRMKKDGFNAELLEVQCRFVLFPDLINQPGLVRVEYENHFPLDEKQRITYNEEINECARVAVERMMLRNKIHSVFSKPSQFPVVSTYGQLTKSLFGENPLFWSDELNSIMVSGQFEQLEKFFSQRPSFFKVYPAALEQFFLISNYHSLTVNQFCAIVKAIPLASREAMLRMNVGMLRNLVGYNTFGGLSALLKTIVEVNDFVRQAGPYNMFIEYDAASAGTVINMGAHPSIKTVEELLLIFDIVKLTPGGTRCVLNGVLGVGSYGAFIPKSYLHFKINSFAEIKQLASYIKEENAIGLTLLSWLNEQLDDLITASSELEFLFECHAQFSIVDILISSLKKLPQLFESDPGLLKRILPRLPLWDQNQLISFLPEQVLSVSGISKNIYFPPPGEAAGSENAVSYSAAGY